MPGSPLKRRKSGALAILPPAEWKALSPARKIEHLLGKSLEDAFVIAHWDPAKCNAHQMAHKQQLIQTMIKHGFKFALEAYRSKEQSIALRELAAALTGAHTPAPENGSNADLSADPVPKPAPRKRPIGKP